MIHLPRLSQTVQIVDGTGRPTGAFLRYHNGVLARLETQDGDIVGQGDAIAGAASQAASAAAKADNALSTAAATTATLALALSYTIPVELLTCDAVAHAITVASHVRHYADGSTVAVTGGTITGAQPSTTYYVTYLDPARSGGSVAYTASTNVAVTVQVQGRHLVGSITTGAA